MEEDKIQESSKFKTFLKRFWNYLIKTFNGMAYGLFATLIIGVIIKQLGLLIAEIDVNWINSVGNALFNFGNVTLAKLMGVGIGIGIAYSLKLEGLKLVVAGISGGIAQQVVIDANNGVGIGDPMVCFITVVITIELLNLILRKKTPIDIILIPLISTLIAFGISLLIGPAIASGMSGLGKLISSATEMQPFIMGIVIAVIMGMCLTAPISSAAIAISIGLSGIAGGAAAIGCSVQMVGFAIMSRKDNNVGKCISVGIGTSMLQFKNILKKPIIWLPTIIVSAILGPVATLLLKAQCTPNGAGMGTSGLVGQFGTFEAMGYNATAFITVILFHIVIPIILVYVIDIIFRKFKLIKEGDLLI